MPYLRNNFDAKIESPRTKVEIKKENNNLVFLFEALDSCLYSYSNKNNAELWKGCVCEVFLDLGDDFYYEFEVAPNGANFIAKIRNRNIDFFDCDFITTSSEIINKNYYVTIHIDLAKLGNPKQIKYNAFRVETKPNEKEQVLSALNPTLCGTFHVREKFISLEL